MTYILISSLTQKLNMTYISMSSLTQKMKMTYILISSLTQKLKMTYILISSLAQKLKMTYILMSSLTQKLNMTYILMSSLTQKLKMTYILISSKTPREIWDFYLNVQIICNSQGLKLTIQIHVVNELWRSRDEICKFIDDLMDIRETRIKRILWYVYHIFDILFYSNPVYSNLCLLKDHQTCGI
jgi:hypothetical protein